MRRNKENEIILSIYPFIYIWVGGYPYINGYIHMNYKHGLMGTYLKMDMNIHITIWLFEYSFTLYTKGCLAMN